jgi:hypothetical protein
MAYPGKTIAFTDTNFSSVYVGQNTPNLGFTGTGNVGIGNEALSSATGAGNTTALGDKSLFSIVDGDENVSIGADSGSNYTSNESYNICISSPGTGGESNTLHLGDDPITGLSTAYVGGIYNSTSISGTQGRTVIIDNEKQVCTLGTATNGELVIGSTGALPVLSTLTAGTGISITNGAGSIIISGTSGPITNGFTSVTSTPYVASSTDYFLGVTTSSLAITIELPNAPATGRTFVVKDSTGNAATNNITITTVGGTVDIDGATTYVINTAYQSIGVLFDGSSYEIF